jgi:hypothetical protein
MAKQARKVGGLGSLGGYDPVLTPLGGEELLMLAAANAGPQMRGYEPSLREQIGNVIYDAAGGLGGLGGIRNRIRDEAMIGLDFIPGLGEALGGEEAGRAFGSGDYLGGGLGLAASALGVVPVVGDAAAAGMKKGIRAFHGSPHDFDRFDMSKIGTGEGAQAYGHGLYFAENEGVARDYRDKLSRQVTFQGAPLGTHPMDSDVETAKHSIASAVANGADPRGAIINQAGDWRQAAEGYARYVYDQSLPQETREAAARQAASFNKIADEIEKFRPDDFAKNPGSMYEVRINADPEEFLDWDAPLKDQPEAARKVFAAAGVGYPEQPIHNTMQNFDIIRGQGRMSGFSPDTSEALRAAGVPGIRYLDAGSRGADGVSGKSQLRGLR